MIVKCIYRTWDDTNYSINYLTLYTGASIPKCGINVNCLGDNRIASICI